MRVAMINRPDYLEVPGGDTTQMVQIKHHLKPLGVDVDHFAPASFPVHSDYDVVHIFNRLTLQELHPQFWHAIEHVPVVATSNFWPGTEHWFYSASRKQRKWRFVNNLLGRNAASSVYRRWQRFRFARSVEMTKIREAYRRCNIVITNSETEIDFLERFLDVCTDFAVVPVGIDRRKYDPKPKASSRFLQEYGWQDFALQVSRIQPNKNQLMLIEALFDLPVPLVFAGQPSPYERDYARECYELGAKRGNTVFTGFWAEQDLPGIFRLASVHVLPSWSELPGIVSLEAAAAGTKVVSTMNGCAEEYLGELASYCDPGSTESIRKAVLTALSAPQTDALRQRVLSEFVWERVAEKMVDVYEEACRAKKSQQ